MATTTRGRLILGRPCPECDGRERYASNGRCVRCERERANLRNATRRAEMGDEAFRAHQAALMRHRRSNPTNYAQDKLVNLARSRALERLAMAHPEELDRYIDVERGLLGLPPRAS